MLWWFLQSPINIKGYTVYYSRQLYERDEKHGGQSKGYVELKSTSAASQHLPGTSSQHVLHQITAVMWSGCVVIVNNLSAALAMMRWPGIIFGLKYLISVPTATRVMS